MILYGTTSLALTGSRGQFYCPRCSRQSDYKQKDVRRFFTLYFIPLIPLNVIETYLECVGCKGRFAMDALHLNKDDYERKSQDAFAQLLLRAMILIMIADGTVDELLGTDGTEMEPGDVFVIETPGGGGYGAP